MHSLQCKLINYLWHALFPGDSELSRQNIFTGRLTIIQPQITTDCQLLLPLDSLPVLRPDLICTNINLTIKQTMAALSRCSDFDITKASLGGNRR